MSSEPRPADPRRLWDTIDRIDARYVDGDTVELTVTVRYSPWCCNGTHEIADAITALDTALHHARVCSHAWVTDPDDITTPDDASAPDPGSRAGTPAEADFRRTTARHQAVADPADLLRNIFGDGAI